MDLGSLSIAVALDRDGGVRLLLLMDLGWSIGGFKMSLLMDFREKMT